MNPNGARGFVLVEAVFSLLVGFFAIALNLELIRRAGLEVLTHHGAFLYVRERALGKSEGKAVERVQDFIHAVREKGIGRSGEFESFDSGFRLVGKFHLRFPALVNFPLSPGKGWKRNFEITKKCRF